MYLLNIGTCKPTIRFCKLEENEVAELREKKIKMNY